MKRLIQVNLLIRRFIHAVVISIFFFTANLVISHAQSSNLRSSGNQPVAVPATQGNEETPSADPDLAVPGDWDPALSDPPATTDQNNSTGDEVLLRPPR